MPTFTSFHHALRWMALALTLGVMLGSLLAYISRTCYNAVVGNIADKLVEKMEHAKVLAEHAKVLKLENAKKIELENERVAKVAAEKFAKENTYVAKAITWFCNKESNMDTMFNECFEVAQKINKERQQEIERVQANIAYFVKCKIFFTYFAIPYITFCIVYAVVAYCKFYFETHKQDFC
jgi:hypothetical protein